MPAFESAMIGFVSPSVAEASWGHGRRKRELNAESAETGNEDARRDER